MNDLKMTIKSDLAGRKVLLKNCPQGPSLAPIIRTILILFSTICFTPDFMTLEALE